MGVGYRLMGGFIKAGLKVGRALVLSFLLPSTRGAAHACHERLHPQSSSERLCRFTFANVVRSNSKRFNCKMSVRGRSPRQQRFKASTREPSSRAYPFSPCRLGGEGDRGWGLRVGLGGAGSAAGWGWEWGSGRVRWGFGATVGMIGWGRSCEYIPNLRVQLT